MELNKDQQIDLAILLATFKSFSEQLHNIKGLHNGMLKKKFNLLLNTTKMYEKQIDRDWLEENQQVIEELTDAITDFIYLLRNGTNTQV